MSKEKYLFVFTLQSVVWQNFGHGVYVFWACQESRTGTRQIIIIRRFFYLFLFWTSYIRLSSMVRPSVHPSIRPSPCPSVRRSVRPSKECENEQSGFCLPITPVTSRSYAESSSCAPLKIFLCINVAERAHAQPSTRAGTFFRALSKVRGLKETRMFFHIDDKCLHSDICLHL